MLVRILDPRSFHRLRGLWENDDWIPDPAIAKVVVAEVDGKIIGFWVAQVVCHLEPIWIRPAERNKTVAGALWKKMQAVTEKVTRIYAFSDTREIDDYLERLGFKHMNLSIFERRQ